MIQESASRTLVKPRRIKAGDRIAAVSPSWGGPGTVPDRYLTGKRQFEEIFNITVVEMPHTLAPADWLARNPAARAQDLMDAFADPSIAGIVATIGGNDSILLIQHLNLDIIRQNPKVFLGYSDTTSLHLACHAAGLASFYGPSIMSGFAENGGMHRFTIDGVRKALFEIEPIGLVPPNTEGWTAEQTDWGDPAQQRKPRLLQPADLPRILQGHGSASGHLLGGCAEVLEMAKATAWWPSLDIWNGAILFYETSEEAPSPKLIEYWLRNFAAQGILQRLNGVLVARPDPAGNESYRAELETTVVKALAEAGLPDLPVLCGLDFGHTQPMLTLPYGVKASIDCHAATLKLLEAGVC
ncbi:S66 family peptidase [Rhizobium sp. LEGMi198b]